MVRVPLGGRRVRGYVAEVADRDPSRLKPIGGVSGDMAVFDEALQKSLVWAAHYYVAPVSVMLERAAPPNLPTHPRPTELPPIASQSRSHPLTSVVNTISARRRHPTTALLSPWGDMDWVPSLVPLLAAEQSVMVIVATAAEASLVADKARGAVGEGRVVEISGDLDDAELTRRWAVAASVPGQLVIGTPRIASWPIASLALSVVIEEGRRAMKDRQTPTVSVRRLLTTRGRLEGVGQVYVGPTPSLELIAGGAELIPVGTRAWPLVEVIDRTEEPPGGGLVSQRTRAAISGMLRQGGDVFVFTHRRGYAPAYRCAQCRELRRCPQCGSRPEPGEACPRCSAPSGPCTNCGGTTFEPLGAGVGRVLAEMRSVFGDQAGAPDEGRSITVGTERDLASLAGVDLAVTVDLDGLAFGSHYRASEEALRILARLAGRVRKGRGHRMIVQTSLPDQPLVTALRRGSPLEFLDAEIAARRNLGYPPSTEMMVVEVRGDHSSVDTDLRSVGDDSVSIMGPAATVDSHRWLIQGSGLGGYKLALRPLVQRWRDSGITVRIDVDPIDL